MFWHGIGQGFQLLFTGNSYVWHVVLVTLQVTAVSTVVAIVLGLPVGLAIGLGRFRGRAVLQAFANIGLALPPVLVGLVLTLLMFPDAPLGRFHLLFTLRGVYIAQSVLAVPVVVALTASSVRALSGGLIEQARALNAGALQVAALALREARLGVFAAVIAAVGGSLSEVGAVVLVGGNVYGRDQTLASAALFAIDQGNFALGVAIGLILFALIALVIAGLTLLQVRGAAVSPATRRAS